MPEPMKLLHLTLEMRWGGGEKQLTRLTRECIAAGCETWIGCREGSRVHAHCQQNQLPFLLLRSGNMLSRAVEIKRLIREHAIELLHLHDSTSHTTGVVAHLIGAKIPMILTRRMNAPIRRNALSRFKYNYPGIQKIICVSEKTRHSLTPGIKSPCKLITIYGITDPLPGDPEAFLRDHPELTGKQLIGFAGSLTPVKNPELFIHTAALIRRRVSGVHFVMMGEGPLRSSLEALVEKLDMSGHFLFTGFRPDSLSVISALEVLLVTSQSEGIPNVILEAQALKIPVVATAVGGVPEIVQDGFTGWLAEPGHAESLAHAVEKIVSGKYQTAAVVNLAYQQLVRFSAGRCIQMHLNVYEEAIND